MKAPLREQLRGESLPEDELSETEQQLLRTVLDRDLQEQWAKALADQGVHREAPPVRRLRTLRLWMAAAAAVLVLVVAAWWLWNTAQSSASQLAEQYTDASAPPPGSIQRGGGTPEPENQARRDAAYSFFNQGNFQAALERISFFTDNQNALVTDHILAGLSYLRLSPRNPTAAIRHLLEARRLDTGGKYADNIHWNLGLAYTLSGNRTQALEELTAVANSAQSRNNEKARMLMEVLGRE